MAGPENTTGIEEAAPATRTVLEVRDLRAYFYTRTRGLVKAVDGVTFKLDAGEILGIVGESGSGKSVTSLAICNLMPQPNGKIVGGEVILDGEDLTKKSDRQMRKIRGAQIAMILQDPMTSLNPSMSIGYQVGEALSIHQGARGEDLRKRVVDALKLVQIPAPELRVGNYPHQMSGGMRQRVGGAIALSCGPQVLIADEPTTSLDVTVQAQYLRLLKEIQQERELGIILITHDLGIVARLCHRVAVMYGGRIVEMGKTQEIFDNPTHPYTISLLRNIPTLEGVGRLESIEGEPPDPANFPPGCRFAPRCPKAKTECHERYPDRVENSPGHWADCWYPGKW